MSTEAAQTLKGLLKSGLVDTDEFHAIACLHFSSAQILEDRVTFPSADRPFALQLLFEKGVIIEVEEGEAATPKAPLGQQQ